MMDCKKAVSRLYEYLDGELEFETADAVREHLEACQRCYPHLRFTAAFRDALHRAAQKQPCCPDELRERIARTLSEAGVERED